MMDPFGCNARHLNNTKLKAKGKIYGITAYIFATRAISKNNPVVGQSMATKNNVYLLGLL